MEKKTEEKKEEGNPYVFSPRPEAHAMKWGELMSPLRRAVRDLLLLLHGAVTQVDNSLKESKPGDGGYITANCFLVYGERGTGKSTVLLTAKEAVTQDEETFFLQQSAAELDVSPKEREFFEDAKRSVAGLRKKGIIWLDPLDLESLPPRANMLTTMLTRVRHALDSQSSVHNPLSRASLLDEGAESARHKLTQLINDATLMWEEIREVDIRNRASHQIAAADIYTRFRERFKDAIGTLSKELGRGRGTSGEAHHIVLPIDNIDRSTDHLHNIIKLAQMVASPYLWLVLAGDREDVETFLERAYWKELITIGEGAVGVGKEGIGKEDESLVMARRQAAAASHKLLPPSHRIKVELVRPEETLRFTRSPDQPSIRMLLDQIKIPNSGKMKDLTLLSLLDAALRYDPAPSDDERHIDLTHAARLALLLPARSVVDLWQQGHRMLRDKARYTGANCKDDFRGEQVARTMLRNSIAESKIPNEMGLYLQDKILHREWDGSTTLKFCKPNPGLKLSRWREIEFERRLYPTLLPEPGSPEYGPSTGPEGGMESQYTVRSTLRTRGNEEVLILSLGFAEGEVAASDLELPPRVAGWLLILHDIVLEAERSWVLLSPVSNSEIRLVSVQHEVVYAGQEGFIRQEKELWWPAPKWDSFLAQDVLWYRWRKFWSFVEDPSCHEKPGGRQKPAPEAPLRLRTDYLTWILATGWIACVLDAFWALTGSKLLRHRLQLEKQFLKVSASFKGIHCADIHGYYERLKSVELRVLMEAAELYAAIMDIGICDEGYWDKKDARDDVFFKQQSVILMRDWLELKLPLMFSHLYVPLCPEVAKQRQGNLEAFLAKKRERHQEIKERNQDDKELEDAWKLSQAWRLNFPFIFADYDACIAGLFPTGKKGPDGTPAGRRSFGLGPYGDLHRLLKSPS